jgi:hypothetical protein
MRAGPARYSDGPIFIWHLLFGLPDTTAGHAIQFDRTKCRIVELERAVSIAHRSPRIVAISKISVFNCNYTGGDSLMR